VLVVEPFFDRILKAGTGHLVSPFVTEMPDGLFAIYYSATRSWARSNAATIKAFREALADAAVYLEKNPESARQILAKATRLPPDVIASVTLPTLRLQVPLNDVKYWSDTLLAQGMILSLIHISMVSVVQREWAAKNPRASYKDKLTVEAVLNSRMIAYPLRILQCCLVTDGGGALILTSADRAADFPHKPVYVLGTGESVETPVVSQMESFNSSRAWRVSGAQAFREAGITPRDVDHLMIYDAFAHLPLYGLCDLGFMPVSYTHLDVYKRQARWFEAVDHGQLDPEHRAELARRGRHRDGRFAGGQGRCV